jgi:hypothetical protein
MTVTTDRKHTYADVQVVAEGRAIPVQHLDSGTRYVEFPQQSEASSITAVGWEPKPGALHTVGYQYLYLHYRDHLLMDTIQPVYPDQEDSVISIRTKYGRDVTIEFIPRVCLDAAITAAEARLEGLKAMRR